jgi:adenosylcobalamin-dependent ribonucleoside-triphosphate reductase
MDYSISARLASEHGDPGFFWLENARAYSRMIDPIDYKDEEVSGANPCNEQSLFSGEACNLVETFPANHSSYEEFERTLKFAYLYAKTVTLLPTHNERTNAIMMRNRRIGTSMSGIVQAFKRHGRNTMRTWADQGYKYLRRLDDVYSRWLCIPRSIKITSVKPSGTTALLTGSTPGIHYPHSEYYFRVIRFATGSPLISKLQEAGYRCIELDQNKEPNTTAVYFAIKEEYFDRSKSEVSIWEQLENAAMLQAYWSDNQVSCTISFKEEEAGQIPYALEIFETRLKGISFMPLAHSYEHAPYQEITEQEYTTYISSLKKLDLTDTTNEVLDRFCTGEACTLPVQS